MIHLVAGDLLYTTAQVVVHGIAAFDPMDQGLALALHKRFPEMHKQFHRWCHQHNPKGGELWFWRSDQGKIIVNLLTQDRWEGHTHRPAKATTQNVNHALHALEKLSRKEGFSSLALPRLATGVGGLDWNDVLPLIENRLGDLGIPVYVYDDYRPGEKAKEPQE
ncbi:MAG: macro domain-containing protein [Gammaproteobacteria bacterium]|nr:macro domain-containing protein [Gammaproteobacteria bacterium]